MNLILEYLASKQLIVEANVNNRQIQFKDLDSKRFLESSCPNVYVVVDNELGDRLKGLQFGLSEESFRSLEAYVAAKLKQKRPCNYCSVQALNPTEVTLHSRQAGAKPDSKAARPKTRRNYQFGFTFAPFGDPREVCHFLGWDFPHISDTVLNMDPQDYSFSDLIELVRIINDDVARFAAEHRCEPFGPIAGVCNHWAGNTIYHQHYQFFCIANIPLLSVVDAARPIAEYKGVVVSRLDWQAPAYVIRCPETSSAHLPFVAERVAKEWLSLNGEDEIDASLGNGIRIKHHTQNTYVTLDGSGALLAVFVPRHRARLGTASPANEIQKLSAGVMEMMGYYLIDSRQFEQMGAWDESKRSYLASSWLRELSAPPEEVRAFEANLHDHLSGPVIGYLERLDACLSGGREQARFRCVADLLDIIDTDATLDDGQRVYVKSRVAGEYNRRIGRVVFSVPETSSSRI